MSDPHSYNLLTERWIPVTWRNDAAEPKEHRVGIWEALDRSNEIKCISHTSPFIEFGLYRLLITIVLDAYTVAGKRPTIGKVRALLSEQHLDAQVIHEYLDKYGEAFDLWNSRLPFLQLGGRNDDVKEPNPKPIVTLFAAIPSGNNVTHWHHYREGEDTAALTENVAAQLLTTVSPFNFKVKPGEVRTLTGDPPLYAVVLGRNLFETIILNLPGRNGRITAKQEQDNGPVWRTPLDLHRLPRTPTIAQGFTWPVRAITLQRDGPRIARAINQAAYGKPTEKAKQKGGNLFDARYGWRDPSAGVKTAADRIAHIKATPGVAIWRDAVPLFLVASEGEALRNGKRRSRPEVISNALRVLDTPRFRVAVYGMRKKGGGGDVKLEEWFRSVLTIPTEVARDSRFSARAIYAFSRVQKVADDLQTALRMLRPLSEAKKADRKRIYHAEADSLNGFWQRLELPLSSTYLEALGSGDSAAEETLLNLVRKEVRAVFAHASGSQRRTADGLFRIANADNWFEGRLNRLLPKPRKEKEP